MSKPNSITVRGVTHTNTTDHQGAPRCPVQRAGRWCSYCARVEPGPKSKDMYPNPDLSRPGHSPNGQVPMRPARKARHTGDSGWTGEMEAYLCRDLRRLITPNGEEWVRVAPAEEALERLRKSYPHYYEVYMSSLDGEDTGQLRERLEITEGNLRVRRHRARVKLRELRASESDPELSASPSQKERT
ncbi:MAG: hypothetical protein ACRDFS_02020 [Chloroflexota bacterium]